MQLIDCESAESYLRETGRIGPRESVRVRRLAGGVSNEVLYVERDDPAADDFVFKQARPQLRVADPWFCSVERIWREVETLQVCAAALEQSLPSLRESTSFWGGKGDVDVEVCVPEVLFEDRENYAFAMTAAPPHEVWKQRLLSGRAEPELAAACGRLLAALHGATWRNQDAAERLGDRTFFDDLRIDPYYRRVAQVHEDLKAPIGDLIESLAGNCLCLVHGDFSPKNLLVSHLEFDNVSTREGAASHESYTRAWRMMLVDFEVGHYGDPAFDLGFFLTHLVLKAFWSGPSYEEYSRLADVFWGAYCDGLSRVASPDEMSDLEARMIRNLAACMLARIDGKSKVEYLSDESLREKVRCLARKALLNPPGAWNQFREMRYDRAIN